MPAIDSADDERDPPETGLTQAAIARFWRDDPARFVRELEQRRRAGHAARMPRIQAAQIAVTPFEQNCALIWDADSKRGVVVDPGGDPPRIEAALARAGFAVDRILLTHGHLDHAGAAMALKAALEAKQGAAVPIEGPHRDDGFLLGGIRAQALEYGLEGMDNATPDRWLDDGDAVCVGGHAFAVLHCPGHSPGHVVFVSKPLGFAVVGDVLFRGSIGRTDFPYGDHAALIGAIRQKLFPLGDEMRFLCGHGPGSTIGEERRSNPFLR